MWLLSQSCLRMLNSGGSLLISAIFAILLMRCYCQCRVVDIPVIENFPATSEDEWSRFVLCIFSTPRKYIFSCRYPNYGLRNADAYLLVYDMSTPDSFNYITFIRSVVSSEWESIMMSYFPVFLENRLPCLEVWLMSPWWLWPTKLIWSPVTTEIAQKNIATTS